MIFILTLPSYPDLYLSLTQISDIGKTQAMSTVSWKGLFCHCGSSTVINPGPKWSRPFPGVPPTMISLWPLIHQVWHVGKGDRRKIKCKHKYMYINRVY